MKISKILFVSKSSVVLVNHVTGPLFIDIANEYANSHDSVVLITGAIEPTYAELDSSITVIRKTRYKRKLSYFRILTWLSFYLNVYVHLLLKGKSYSKALLVTNPPIMPFIGARLLPTKKIEFDILVYDIYPDALANFGYIRTTSFLYKAWDKMNRVSYENAERVITISSVMKEVISRNLQEEKIEIIYPWVDTGFIKPMNKEDNWFVKEYRLEEKTVLMYSGNMGATHDLLTPLKVSKTIQESHPNYHFLYIGDGVQKKGLMKFVNQNQLKNVTFLPFQKPETLPFSFASADFGIVSLGIGAEGLSVPSKTFYFLSAGVSIMAITRKESEIDRLVSNHNCGVSVEAENMEEMIRVLTTTSALDISTYKKNSRKLSAEFTVKNAKEFLS